MVTEDRVVPGSCDEHVVAAVTADRAEIEDAVVADDEVVPGPTEDVIVAASVRGAVRSEVVAGNQVAAHVPGVNATAGRLFARLKAVKR